MLCPSSAPSRSLDLLHRLAVHGHDHVAELTSPLSSRVVGCKPALAAGPSGVHVQDQSRPSGPAAASSGPGRTRAQAGVRQLPFCAMICGTTRLISSTGMAKPMPAEVPDGLKMAVFMPISRPALSSSGPPELPGLIGGVGLDHVVDRPLRRRLDLAAQGADDAGGQRLVQAERVADGEGLLADLQVVRRADGDRHQLRRRRVDVQHGDVLVGVEADDRAVVRLDWSASVTCTAPLF